MNCLTVELLNELIIMLWVSINIYDKYAQVLHCIIHHTIMNVVISFMLWLIKLY